MKKLLLIICLILLVGIGCEKPVEFSEQKLGAGISEHLKLKVTKDKILGSKVKDGEVKYAYTKDIPVSDIPSSETVSWASTQGLNIISEVKEKRTANSKTFKTDTNTFVLEVIAGEPQYYKDKTGNWLETEYATTTEAVFLAMFKPTLKDRALSLFGEKVLALEAGPFFPDANGVDGYIQYPVPNIDTSWAACHDALTGGAVDSSSASAKPALIYSSDTGSGWRAFNRSLYVIDTSSLPDTAIISSSTFSLYVTAHQQTFSGSVALVSSNPTSDTAIITADYDQLGTTDYATDVVLSTMTNNSYNNWTLNATGIAAISKTGVTKLGIRIASDADNAEPSETAADQSDQFTANFSESAGTTTDPKLLVTYTEPATAVPKKKPNIIIFD